MESFGAQRCRTLCWVAAGLLGLFVVYLLMHYWDMRFLWAMLTGMLAFFFLGWLIPIFACAENPADMPVRRMPTPTQVQPRAEPAAAPAMAASPAVSAPAAPKAAAPKATPKSVKPKPSVKTAKAAVKPVKVAKPAAEAKASKAKKAAEPVKVAAVEAPAAKLSKPAGLAAARGGKADDLKVIVGVGPAMEQLLNKLGYFHFDQIAAWKAAEVAWVDDNLEGFKGRVTRDKWVAQAKKLAKA